MTKGEWKHVCTKAHHRLVYTNNPSTNPDIHDVRDILQTPKFS